MEKQNFSQKNWNIRIRIIIKIISEIKNVKLYKVEIKLSQSKWIKRNQEKYEITIK